MFKRIIWLGTGAAVGASGAFWAKHKVERTVERYLPDRVAARLGTSGRHVGRTVRAAASEGRDAMRATEAELRARVEARTFTGPAAPAVAVDPADAVDPAVPRPSSARAVARRRSRR